jgi:hypothetical protein
MFCIFWFLHSGFLGLAALGFGGPNAALFSSTKDDF